ncbi:MAG: diphthamide biosynthesis enzyme Dph2 [Candidatus Aenigmatarchaeota archaeon]
MKILLQVPEGLKSSVLRITREFEKAGNEVLISCEPCYGACDLRDSEAKRLGCEKIIHYGHSKFVDSEIPVEYVEIKSEEKIILPNSELKNLEQFKKIGLVSTLQFVDSLPQIKKQLEKTGKEVFIGKSDNKNLYAGQILGCNTGAAIVVEKKVDCFLYIGSGKFHPLGVALASKKHVFVFDTEKNRIEKIETEKFLKQKLATIELARDAKTFGILVSTKPGQTNLKAAEELKKRIEKSGRSAHILVMDEIKPDKVDYLGGENSGIDAFINTACPRIGIEDRILFKKPILNLDETEEIIS